MPNPKFGNPLPFLRCWTKDPFAVGLPFASSCRTARRLARAALDAALPHAGPILELGAGTGVVTEALIEQGCPPSEIVAIERDAGLCRDLKRRFRGLQVLQGDALNLGRIIERAQIPVVRVVLSGLPMRAVPPRAAANCYADAFALMPSGGSIIQDTYGFRPPVDPKIVDRRVAGPTLEATFIGREWRNLPPIGIWGYRCTETLRERNEARRSRLTSPVQRAALQSHRALQSDRD